MQLEKCNKLSSFTEQCNPEVPGGPKAHCYVPLKIIPSIVLRLGRAFISSITALKEDTGEDIIFPIRCFANLWLFIVSYYDWLHNFDFDLLHNFVFRCRATIRIAVMFMASTGLQTLRVTNLPVESWNLISTLDVLNSHKNIFRLALDHPTRVEI